MTNDKKKDRQALFVTLSPMIFVLLWSTGFVGARLSAPYADPLTFLFVRFVIAGSILLPLAMWRKQVFPRRFLAICHSAVAGILLHAIYLGGVFYVVRHGLPIAICALIVSLQPALASVAAALWLREKLSGQQLAGLILGFAGVAAVLYPQLSSLDVSAELSNAWVNISVTILALLGITAGTIYQKRFCGGTDILPGVVIQFFASAVVIFCAAALLEDMKIEWNEQSIFALLWLVFVLSIGAILILLYLIERRAVSSVNALFYLSPALVAIEGYFLFGQTLHFVAIMGFVCSLCGVYLITRGAGR